MNPLLLTRTLTIICAFLASIFIFADIIILAAKRQYLRGVIRFFEFVACLLCFMVYFYMALSNSSLLYDTEYAIVLRLASSTLFIVLITEVVGRWHKIKK